MRQLPLIKEMRIVNLPLRVLNINFQSIKRKQHIVNNIIESSKPDIVIGNETWLNPTSIITKSFLKIITSIVKTE
jgi:hypothetical protein